MTVVAVLAAAVVASAVTHWWDRRTVAAADIIHYDHVHRDATPTRQVVADNDRLYRLYRRALREATRRAAVIDALYDRLNSNTPRRPTVRLPAPSAHRLGWRDRARWFTPWPQAAITRRGPA